MPQRIIKTVCSNTRTYILWWNHLLGLTLQLIESCTYLNWFHLFSLSVPFSFHSSTLLRSPHCCHLIQTVMKESQHTLIFRRPSSDVPAPYGITYTISTVGISSPSLFTSQQQHRRKISWISSTVEGYSTASGGDTGWWDSPCPCESKSYLLREIFKLGCSFWRICKKSIGSRDVWAAAVAAAAEVKYRKLSDSGDEQGGIDCRSSCRCIIDESPALALLFANWTVGEEQSERRFSEQVIACCRRFIISILQTHLILCVVGVRGCWPYIYHQNLPS